MNKQMNKHRLSFYYENSIDNLLQISLHEPINCDMRLIWNAGFWAIGRRCRTQASIRVHMSFGSNITSLNEKKKARVELRDQLSLELYQF
jgi:hypothetical protein